MSRTIVTIEMGGTGANTAAAARNAIGAAANTGGTFSGAINAATANISTIETGNALTLSTGTASNGNIIFSSNGTEEMRITNIGFIGIFTTTPNSNLTIVGNVWATTGINAATMNSTTMNAATFISSAGINVGAQVINAYGSANLAYEQANNARAQANSARDQANTARSDANTTFATINTTFATLNTSAATQNTNIGNAHDQANAARLQANTARTTANDAYNTANTRLSTSGGSISGDLSITGNLTVQGNATTINVSNLSVNDSIILLANGAVGDSTDIGFVGHFDRGPTATHAGLIRKATLNEFFLFDNYEVEPTNNVIDVAGQNFRVGNLRLGIVNANSVLILGSAAATQANLTIAHNQANSARDQANTAYGQANLAYAQANSARSDANTTFATINTTFATINTTTATMNTATSNRVLKAGDTMTGQLNISSGGLLVTGNVGFGMPSPIFPLQVRTNTGTPPQALQLNTTDWTTTIGSSFQFGFGAATGNTYSEIRALSGGYNAWNNLVLQSGGGNVGVGVTNPFSRLQVGTHTFSGANGVFGDDRAGITVHGSLTSIMYASTYNNANFPDYGLVFVHGANTSNYNVWSLSPDGPAKGNSLNFIYGANATNIHTTTPRVVFRGDGNVGIGTTNPSNRLHVNGEIRCLSDTAGRAIYVRARTANSDNIIQFEESDGSNLWEVVGRGYSAAQPFYIFKNSGTGSGLKYIINSSGNHTFNGDMTVSGTITESSSITIKENIDPITNALNSITKLIGVTYDRKDGTGKRRAGLIAEEVEKILPNVVNKDEEGKLYGIQYTNLIAYLIESIKELKAEIDTLKK